MGYSDSSRSFRLKSTASTPLQPRIFGRRGAVAAEHYLATLAGIDMLKAGGNAVDAAVSATMVEGLVNPQMHTIGGEMPVLIHAPGQREPICINGNMVAPERATPEEFRRRGFDKIPPDGVLAAGVPGAMGGLLTALLQFGRLSFADVAAPALELAKNGFPVHAGLLRQHGFGITDNATRFRTEWKGSAGVYLPNDEIPTEGDLLKNPAFADMLDYLVSAEREAGTRSTAIDAAFAAFYKGDVAAKIVAFVAERDGLLQRSDFDAFSVPTERAVSTSFHGVDLYKPGPWTQGPAVLQALSILKNHDLKALGHNSAAYIHLVTEAMKLAFSDREQFYGDPAFVDVAMDRMLDDAYGRLRSGLIDDTASDEVRPGDPVAGHALLPTGQRLGGSAWGPGTVHVDAMDNEGLSAAFTPSGAWIKSSEVIPALGFPLGSRLSNFQLGPAHHPNVVAPFKRPRTTISPSMAVVDGKPWIAFGSMGGDQQDQWQLQFFLNRVVFDMTLTQAIEAPKFSSEHFPGLFHPHNLFLKHLRVEESVGADVIAALRERGHDVGVAPAWTEGFLCATERNPKTGVLEAAVDLRGSKSEVFSAMGLAF